MSTHRSNGCASGQHKAHGDRSVVFSYNRPGPIMHRTSYGGGAPCTAKPKGMHGGDKSQKVRIWRNQHAQLDGIAARRIAYHKVTVLIRKGGSHAL